MGILHRHKAHFVEVFVFFRFKNMFSFKNVVQICKTTLLKRVAVILAFKTRYDFGYLQQRLANIQ